MSRVLITTGKDGEMIVSFDYDLDSLHGHTPGPWVAAWDGEADDWGDKCGEGLGVVAVGAGGVCEIWPRIRPKEEMIANADLIAAAPFLLTEVIRLKAENEQLKRSLGGNDAIHDNSDNDSGR